MANRKPGRKLLTNSAGEVRELTARDATEAVPFSELPEAERKLLLSIGKRGPQKKPKKVPISIRLSADVANGLRATGDGWQRRADEVLRSWLANPRGSTSLGDTNRGLKDRPRRRASGE